MTWWEKLAIAERVAEVIRVARLNDRNARPTIIIDRAIRSVASERGLRFAEVELCVELAS